MTTTRDIALPHAPSGVVGQATQIEQSRAAAEVFAAVLAAKQAPRDVQAAIRDMSEACQMRELAERAFFRFSRGGGQVSGASVHLARELARCWGNIQYGVAELRRDDAAGQSEMQAFAWDLQSNARSAAIFIVPHARDKRGGPERLTDMRDIYENNANNAARRVREALFAVLPLWFVEQAKTLCTRTLQDGGGMPLPQRIAGAIERFAGLGVSEAQLVEKVGRASSSWTALDLAPLTVIYQSIQRGEISRDDEFPTAVVSGEQIAAAASKARGRAKPKPADPPVPADDDEAEMLREQQEMERELAEREAADDDVRSES